MEARGTSGDSAARAALRSRIANPSSIRLDELQPNPRNPRYVEDDPEIQELAETLERVGQLQPAVVMPVEQYLRAYPELHDGLGPQPWVVIVGNRRLAAARLAGRRSLDVRVDAEIQTPGDVEDRILIENIQRKDLPALLEAEHLQRRLDRPGETVRSVGAAVGKSHTYVQQRLDLLRMIPEFQDLFRRGEINIKTGRQFGAQPEDVQRAALAAGPPFSSERPRPVPEPDDEPEAVNPVYSADDPQLVSPVATADGPELVNRVYSADGPEPVNPVYSVSDAHADPTPDTGEAPTLRNGSVPTQRYPDVEAARISVSQWLDNALAELDRALPASGEGPMGQALADARASVLEARAALDRVPRPVSA